MKYPISFLMLSTISDVGEKNSWALTKMKVYPQLFHHLFIVLRSISHRVLNNLLLYCTRIFPGASIQWCHQHTFHNRAIMTAYEQITAAGNKQNYPDMESQLWVENQHAACSCSGEVIHNKFMQHVNWWGVLLCLECFKHYAVYWDFSGSS